MPNLNGLFKLQENNTTLATEIRAGVADGGRTGFANLVTGRGRRVHWLIYLFAALFIARYVYVGT